MKHWYCSPILALIFEDETDTRARVIKECEDIERDGYKVEQIVYVDGQYQIFYTKND